MRTAASTACISAVRDCGSLSDADAKVSPDRGASRLGILNPLRRYARTSAVNGCLPLIAREVEKHLRCSEVHDGVGGFDPVAAVSTLDPFRRHQVGFLISVCVCPSCSGSTTGITLTQA